MDEKLNGCLSLNWNEQRNNFDIEYTNKCEKCGVVKI